MWEIESFSRRNPEVSFFLFDDSVMIDKTRKGQRGAMFSGGEAHHLARHTRITTQLKTYNQSKSEEPTNMSPSRF